MKKKNKYIQPLIVTVILEDDAGGGLLDGSPTIKGDNMESGDGNTGNGDPTKPPTGDDFSAKSGFGSGFSLFDDDDLESDY